LGRLTPERHIRESESGLWVPTPVCHDHKVGINGRGLGALAKREWWPTPTAHNAKEGNYLSESERNTPTLAAQVGGPLNPDWVEWLMGWPVGWTDLKPLETAKFQQWLDSHGRHSDEA